MPRLKKYENDDERLAAIAKRRSELRLNRLSQMTDSERNESREAHNEVERRRFYQLTASERNSIREAAAASKQQRISQVSDSERIAIRQAEAESKRRRISQLSDSERNAIRQAEAESKRRRISQLSDSERDAIRQADAESKRRRLSELSDSERNAIREADAESKRRRLSELSDSERNAIREADAESKRRRIFELSDSERNAIREADAASKRQRISDLTDVQRNEIRDAEAASRRQRISEMSEAQQKIFRETRATVQRERRYQMSDTEAISVRHAQAELQRQRTLQLNSEQRVEFRQRANESRRGVMIRHALPSLGIALQHHTDIHESSVSEHYCGPLNERCENCCSLNFKEERPQDQKFSICCHKGKVGLIPIKLPDIIQKLLKNEHSDSPNFLNNIRKFNSALAFASMGAQVKPPPGHGPYCFRVHGQVYHQSGPLHPINGEARKFAQIYILDPEEALNQRLGIMSNAGCNASLMNTLGKLMSDINPFAKAYKMMHEVEIEENNKAQSEGREIHEISMAIVSDRIMDQRRYNLPTVNEVAIVFSSVDGAPPFDRDIRVNLRAEHRTRSISVLHPGLDPMTYPLLFPYGDEGWKPNIKHVSGPRNVTQLQYYSYRLAIREEFDPILNSGKLTQQYCVDSYCKIEANRLNYIQLNQKHLRVEKYNVLNNLNANCADKGLKPGKQFILPSSFQGSPRAMNQHYQDAMAIVRRYGKPDLFITMTCNPKWQEITENLENWQRAEYRPDLVARVFRLKLKQLLKDITEHHVLGVDLAKIHVIEFQKRGLPHAHILVILQDDYKPRTEEIINAMISAEIPDPLTHPRLHQIVLKNMIHGPCGLENPDSPCMSNGECTKRFPKEFSHVTQPNFKGYPIYMRRDTGVKHSMGTRVLDNRWVVPYNPYLSLKYNCHINTEICASIQSIKYLFLYVYKGHDCATVEVRRSSGTNTLDHNEIESHIDSRYVSAPEAIWRIFEFRMHEQSHFVQKLCIHLPHEQPIYFEEGEEIDALERAVGKDDTLTAWFKLNQTDVNARQYLYCDIPEHYTFVKKDGTWKPRKIGHSTTIGRMYNISVSQGELFYLRLLLLHVRGPVSFEHIKTIEGVESNSFKESALRMHLLDDDCEWDKCLLEAVDIQMPYQLRELFAFICIYSVPTSAITLWEKYKTHFIEDFVHQGLNEEQATDHALQDVQATLVGNNRTLKSFGLPEPSSHLPSVPVRSIDLEEERNLGSQLVHKLNRLQQEAFDKIMQAVSRDDINEKLFFLDGPGGSGKTFTYETLYHTISGLTLHVTCCASTGIAATLLPFGRTYHSTFGLGPTFDKTTVSAITVNTAAGRALRDTAIIVWDEITMTPFYALDVIDRLLRDLTNDNRPFGGKVILLGGDFRQCLPVVKHGNRVKIVESCIQSSILWEKFSTLKLSTNMRVSDANEHEFREWLLKLGNGELTNSDGLGDDIIEIPPDCVEHGSLLDSVFGEKIFPDQVQQFQHKGILCPKNEHVHLLNQELLTRLQGELRTYSSVDSIVQQENINPIDYPMEFLNSLTPPGTPPHSLTLKKGAIIMLLRNLNSSRGLCNGTRLTIVEMRDNFIIAKVLSGKAEGQTVFIPRIEIIPSDTDLPFQLKRRQFPIILAFVMSINKSQGQSFDSVGIYLPSPVFSHGQLYVAFSRGRSKQRIKVKVLETSAQGKLISGSNRVFTRNVVYKEVFHNASRRLAEVHEAIMDIDYYDLITSGGFSDEFMVDIPDTLQLSSQSGQIPSDSLPIDLEFEPDPDNWFGWYTSRPVFDIHGAVIAY